MVGIRLHQPQQARHEDEVSDTGVSGTGHPAAGGLLQKLLDVAEVLGQDFVVQRLAHRSDVIFGEEAKAEATSVSRHRKSSEHIIFAVHNHVDLRSKQVIVGWVETSQLAHIPHNGRTLEDHLVVVHAQRRDLSEGQLAAHFEVVEFVRVHPEVIKFNTTVRTGETNGFTLAGDVKVVQLQFGVGLLTLVSRSLVFSLLTLGR
mmetsp:Transcript_52111/g.90978  ORF Transcript_52111/g.90978 Transcript_52111/m.90978 type:complete len:203 (-) Transcript_52111:99-707(-)